jgi:rubrerythrin
MTTEQDRILEALQIAVQMEIDGKEFYRKASQESSNELGKKLLETLAAEEDIHRQKFEEIYRDIRDKNDWKEVDFQPDEGRTLRTIFARATEEMNTSLKAQATEIEAIKTAMDMENKSYDFYRNQSQTTNRDKVKGFYDKVAAEERGHYLVLSDYYEYLSDPAGWFVKTEHPSLDGG